ncbi:MAG: ATP-dependent helicase HrpB [gamma proteobacterium symbiont of Bathyaustriella thionipta]|nr:ATP-dependent helicase HrpB [gamma proteobacterium symbiont of Bathyaustriella thionipta]
MLTNESALPALAAWPELKIALQKNRPIIFSAPPGTGKSTAIPLQIMSSALFAGQRILLVQPRRLAAVAIANRLAALCHEKTGQRVGFQVRHERKISKNTRLEVVTDGILLSRLQADPALEGYALVILDEFHERSLNLDVSLALLRDVQQHLREDLRLMLMSATLPAGKWVERLAAHPVHLDAKSWPVELVYSAAEERLGLEQNLLRLIRRALQDTAGDVLVFLPGQAQIKRLQALAAELPLTVLPLYGDLSLQQQAQVLRPAAKAERRLILATNIAETSLTIEGVTAVVDSGLERQAHFDLNNGLDRLLTGRISQASATQRAGRAGRVAAGSCYRLWSAAAQQRLQEQTPAQIFRQDLSDLVLQLARWGSSRESLQWIDAPPAAAFQQAQQSLMTLGLLDRQQQITELGQQAIRLPLAPRLAAMLLQAQQQNMAALACDLAAILSERDFMPRHSGSDIEQRLRLLRDWRGKSPLPRSIDQRRVGRIDRIARQLAALIKVRTESGSYDERLIAFLLMLAWPDRVAQRREAASLTYRLASGRAVHLHEQDNMRRHEWLLAASLDAGEAAHGKIYLCAALDVDWLSRHEPSYLHNKRVQYWHAASQAVRAEQLCQLQGLTLRRQSIAVYDLEQAQQLLLQAIQDKGLALLPWTPDAQGLLARMRSLALWQPEAGWPDMSERALMNSLEKWLSPWLADKTAISQLAKLDMSALLRSRMDWSQQPLLDQLAPDKITLPNGRKARLNYQDGQPPILQARVQELFGWLQTPCVCQGKIPLQVHLLSPARRPVQITSDLQGFWQTGYAQVVKELKGRYPKHYWPDDPFTAQAISGVRPKT